ncbi:hypothetical protein CDL15_Pgr005087 [Punica granatum]|uniref:Uncharacterized protein n=1 Tax=Punica granatum TaxID=22663 RepID=A0A218WX35_PUNGR|nr:hypothetical protein CDL15_Pgr005087 [Punica granatum]
MSVSSRKFEYMLSCNLKHINLGSVTHEGEAARRWSGARGGGSNKEVDRTELNRPMEIGDGGKGTSG